MTDKDEESLRTEKKPISLKPAKKEIIGETSNSDSDDDVVTSQKDQGQMVLYSPNPVLQRMQSFRSTTQKRYRTLKGKMRQNCLTGVLEFDAKKLTLSFMKSVS